MLQENVEIVRRLFEANRHDVKAFAELSHEDLEFASVATVEAEEATFRQPDTWAGYFAAMDRRVVCLFRIAGSGKQSGVPVQQAVAVAYRIRLKKVWRMWSYLNPSEALEAVGLSE